MVVAGEGNQFILKILKDMSKAMAEKRVLPCYSDEPRRFISHTTGSKLVGKTVESHGYEPQVTVFSMCRPVRDLEMLLSVDLTGRVCGHEATMDQYDVLSAFSMSSSTGNDASPP